MISMMTVFHFLESFPPGDPPHVVRYAVSFSFQGESHHLRPFFIFSPEIQVQIRASVKSNFFSLRLLDPL